MAKNSIPIHPYIKGRHYKSLYGVPVLMDGDKIAEIPVSSETFEQLSAEFIVWLQKNDFPQQSALDLLVADDAGEIRLTPDQEEYLIEFEMRWRIVALGEKLNASAKIT